MERRATASFASAMCIYGTIGWAVAYIDLPSDVVALFRGVIGAAFIVIVTLAAKRRYAWEPVRENLKWLAAGGLSLGMNWVLVFAAFRATTVAVATLCNYMAPVILVFIAPFVLGEKRNLKKIACALVAVVGMAMISGLVGGGTNGVTLGGIALGLGGAMFSASVVICNKKLGAVPVFERSATQLAFSAVAALPFALVNNMGIALSPDALSIGLVVLLGVFHTGVAYCLFFRGISGLSAQTAAVLEYIAPAMSIFVSTLILHEPLSIVGWAGAVLIIGAASMSEVIGRDSEGHGSDIAIVKRRLHVARHGKHGAAV